MAKVELSKLDATAAIEVKPMSRAMGLALLPGQVSAALLGTMGTLGLMLAAMGLYGVLSYSVSRRTREIGVRIALGVTPAEVLRIVSRHCLTLVAGGFLAGFAMQPLALFLVPGLSTLDGTVFLAVTGVLGVVAMLATLAPARRVLRVDPLTALRYE